MSDNRLHATPQWLAQYRRKHAALKAELDDVPLPAVVKEKAPAGPNKTEMDYYRTFLEPRKVIAIRYEGITLRLQSNHRYTPDFVVLTADGIELIEVKGSYKLHSHQRARLAFDEARVQWPCFKFYWAEKQKGGNWERWEY